MMMTEEELVAFEDANWATVPEPDRDHCVRYLTRVLHDLDAWRSAMKEPGFHMFGGMQIRNALREVLADGDLPDVSYPDGESHDRNWDDFYRAALREALGDE